VLDDATSAVDATTEETIFAALREVLAGRTTLLVAHRVSTLHLADRVVLLGEGRVLDQGGHAELLARSGAYRALLTGIEDEESAAIGDSIEQLSAWTASKATNNGTRPIAVPRAAMGPGMGRGGGWRLNLAPTPELLAQVEALPPVRDRARIDLARESAHDPHFGLGSLLRAFRAPLALGLLLVVLDALAGLAGPVLVKTGVDDGVVTGSGQVLFWASAAYLLVTLADLIDQIGATLVTGRTAERVMLGLRIRIWAQLQRLSLDFYERELAGRIMTRMTSDVDQFESLMENGFLNALVAIVTFVGVGVALLATNLELGLCVLLVIVPLAIATVIFRRITTRLYDVVRERLAVVNADFQESLSGVREAQAFVHEQRTIARFHDLGRRYFDGRLAAQRTIATYFPFVQFLSAVADVIVLGVGATLIERGHLTTGALIAFLLYIDMFFSPIQQLSQVFDAWQQTRVSVDRIAELMALDTLTPEPEDPVRLPRPPRGEVTLDRVRFCYPNTGAAEALAGLSLRIRAGETVALVGETGAGKSTVLKLVARFYDPTSGAVRFDDRDLRTLALRDFRTHLGYVPQESFLFSGTLRDNIAYGRPGASDAEVEAAARAVGAHDFVARQPGGYLHQVSERGASLSAGQRQLIALARAALVDPALLLLDEATANLDLVTEHRVTRAMAALSQRRTTVLIAHRLQTARTADRIAVVADGVIAEIGSHDELLAHGGRYAAMWRAFETVGPGSAASGGR
jgi:ATP-binding cassette subfamily B protein